MTVVTVGARHGMCRHNRHHRHCRHRRHNAGGVYMAYIQQRGERKYKITVCNGYTTTGKKRMQARTIDVPKEIPKRSIRQYVYAEAERLENDSAPASTKVKTPSSRPTQSIGWTGQPSDTKPVRWPVIEKCWRWHIHILAVCRSARSGPWSWRNLQKNCASGPDGAASR